MTRTPPPRVPLEDGAALPGGAESPGGTERRAPAPGAVVVAAEKEMRILLRGLLQLHRRRVLAEAAGRNEALRAVRELRPGLIVADTRLDDGTVGELVTGARAIVPGIRVVLVAPSSRPPPGPGPGAGPDVLLLRPFCLQQFAEAVAPPTVGP